ncbi:DegT/DnrJ/EryC1/StrS aminotransferase family protein [Parvularcula sp. ZS-1/3]|uniref:DegT/DnrJ/EryC1/StrS aminotransferase family protein n=1 Tax=Parvularcula mediterranea TaxID=2732508 RepID=A0A7Y3RJG9_9PROT|nr:DegT/DnrJ/EryC1/StrS aminotransferase family protein [Parvularcula mediterranea]NNU14790.1 DegT/DnrJ/EryC1/StrS aminotransferase family protein [Parvularcula mediterranea]
MGIAFIDLQAQRARISDKVDAAIARVLEHGRFIMGPEVTEFEEKMSAFSGARLSCGCGNGTDALALPLMAWGLRPGDAVFCPSFTFTATAEVVPWLGASPVFVDIEPDTYNMDPVSLEAAIEDTIKNGELRPKAVIAVDLFGQPANYPAIKALCDKHGLKLISDSAQGFGCTIDGKHPIEWADVVTTSFFPAKPLGCYGDGGAIQTNDQEMWDLLDSLRVHGKASQADMDAANYSGHEAKYLNPRIGMNSRLDTMQAAILLEKLAIFADEIALREKVARSYNSALEGSVAQVPFVKEGYQSVWAQYTIEVENRAEVQKKLGAQGIPTAVYYPIPMHEQAPYRRFPTAPDGLPVTEEKKHTVMSLPMHPYLDEETQGVIVEGVKAAV